MAKYDKIKMKKSSNKSIKEAEKRGDIKEKSINQNTRDFNWSDFRITDELKPVQTEPFMFEPQNLNIPTISVSDFLYSPIHSQSEQRFEQIHEELADVRKYVKGLEDTVVSLTTVVTSVMHEKNRMKKQIKDQHDEFQEWFKKYGEPLIYLRNKIIEMRKENRIIQNCNKNQDLDKYLRKNITNT